MANLITPDSYGDVTGDAAPAINAALADPSFDTLYLCGKTIYTIGSTLENPLLKSIKGLGVATGTIIAPLPTFPAGAPFLVGAPAAGYQVCYTEYSGFMIYPGMGGTVIGGDTIVFSFAGPNGANLQNLAHFHMADIYCGPTNGVSFRCDNAAGNLEGNITLSVIERCLFWSGVEGSLVGDTVTFRDNTIRGSGLKLGLIDAGGGWASMLVVENNNIVPTNAEAINVTGRAVKVIRNQIENNAGCGVSASSIFVSGDVAMPEIVGNTMSFYGATKAQSGICVSQTKGAIIDRNSFFAGVPLAAAVYVAPGSVNTQIGTNGVMGPISQHLADQGASTGGSNVWVNLT